MTARPKTKLKVGYVLAYKSPDYIRTRVLLKALGEIAGVAPVEIVNNQRGFLRYPETLLRLLIARFTDKPDLYILGFRGHEIYWPVRLITLGKPLIFDEFINMHDWLVVENKTFKPNSMLARVAHAYTKSVLSSAQLVLTDTVLGARSSSKTYDVSLSKYRAVYVGEDEAFFNPKTVKSRPRKSGTLEVFFYGNMPPLHGVQYILGAALALRNKPIHFYIVGGKGRPATVKMIKKRIARDHLDNVTYEPWVAFDRLPEIIGRSDICLGGPFGGTSQAKRVITGKTFQFLAMARPTIVGKINEQVGLRDRENCILVRQASIGALVEALEWALTHQDSLPKIGKNGYRLFMERFSTPAIAKQLKEVLEHESQISLP